MAHHTTTSSCSSSCSALAALFLLIRIHAFEEQATWCGGASATRGGLASSTCAAGRCSSSWPSSGRSLLTTTASSAPLAGRLDGHGRQLVELGRDFQRFLPPGGAIRAARVSTFGDTATISGDWSTDESDGLRGQSRAGRRRLPLARGDLRHVQAERLGADRAAATTSPPATPCSAGADERRRARSPDAITFRVTPDDYRASTIVVARIARSRSTRRVRVSRVGADGWFPTVERRPRPVLRHGADPGAGDDEDGTLTRTRCVRPGTAYPPEITRSTRRARGCHPGGPATRSSCSTTILAEVARTRTTRTTSRADGDYLADDANFEYDTDVRDLALRRPSTVECFATLPARATASTTPRRWPSSSASIGIPARVV